MLRSSSPGEYSYDYTTPTTTTTRSTSPLHFLNPAAMAHLTHHHHNSHCHSHRASAAAAAADISRLLDPSYIPSSSSRAAHLSSTTVTAYVDPHGDLHDPDYRHFPISSPPSSHNPHNHHTQNKNVRRGASPRPHFDWEMDLDEHALDDEYDEEDTYTKNLNSRYAPASTTSRSWTSSNMSPRPRESSFSTMSMYTPTYYSPTGTASTLPTSYEDDDSLPAESPFDEKEKKKGRRLSKGDKEKERMKALEKEKEEKEAEAERERERESERAQEIKEKETRRSSFEQAEAPVRRSRSLGRSRPQSRRRNIDFYEEDEDREDEDQDEDDSAHLHPPSGGSSPSRGSQQDYVPTCTQSLRRQWQALALSFRFSVFRAQRRMTRRVASLTT